MLLWQHAPRGAKQRKDQMTSTHTELILLQQPESAMQTLHAQESSRDGSHVLLYALPCDHLRTCHALTWWCCWILEHSGLLLSYNSTGPQCVIFSHSTAEAAMTMAAPSCGPTVCSPTCSAAKLLGTLPLHKTHSATHSAAPSAAAAPAVITMAEDDLTFDFEHQLEEAPESLAALPVSCTLFRQ